MIDENKGKYYHVSKRQFLQQIFPPGVFPDKITGFVIPREMWGLRPEKLQSCTL